MIEKQSHQIEHRNRLRKRIVSGGEKFLHDYELLEVMLFSVFPRKDTKPLSKKLLTQFKTLKGILDSETEELKSIPGIGEGSIATIKCIKEVLSRILLQRVQKNHVLSNWKALTEYLTNKIGNKKVENFLVLYMDKKNQILDEELNSSGTIDKISIHTREIVKKALFLGSSSVILSHNHPSGDPTPSQSDQQVTSKIQFACESTDIEFIDHIIVTPNPEEYFSFRNNGLL